MADCSTQGARKLACSKEPDGCSRCRREGLNCVYSPQKPMGRPRKRRHLEGSESDDQQVVPKMVDTTPTTTTTTTTTTQGASAGSSMTDPLQLPLPLQVQCADPSKQSGSTTISGLETDFSWYNDTGKGDLDVLSSASFLDTYSHANGSIIASTLPLDFSTGGPDTMFGEPPFPSDDFHFGGANLLDGIDFNESYSADKPVFQDISDDLAGILSSEAFQTATPAATAPPPLPSAGLGHTGDRGDTSALPLDLISVAQGHCHGHGHGDFPSDSSSSISGASASETSLQTPPSACDSVAPENTSPMHNKHNHKALPQASCACLSQIYLSLDALSRLPEDVVLAMGVARAAAKAAHDVVVCPACSKPFVDDPAVPLPIQSVQNMMMLGALIPTTVNAYIKILELVDEATARAREKGEKMVFRFTDYGGLWGCLGEMDKVSCRSTVVEMYDNRVMEPDQWRHTVRAVLKVDLYGFRVDGRTTVDEKVVSDGHSHSHRRSYDHSYGHPGLRDVVTAMENRSKRRHDNFDALVAAGRQPMCSQGTKDRPCLKIVEMARLSLEKLEIA
ncbi:hypothetical protein SODALDRAFT_335089 [Sodiomyces alkalinus F11]|uniref:Zn(2)-C6 fungal-type domain-containing protein n=1 Tax=Sodiomyces alkalinus (strain CBS 110278 / VKM F-3762 / F11) TaxID=1314773 RepID=A0A3N2PQW8_SODAK|nr:hypothetical protein SODALDRAFT_335089 [Sodiomyces alkalinus F11]ROT36875.1 hypothetical protein SODALDRAFT_335089 [Sodiomyces alkalinus F11]